MSEYEYHPAARTWRLYTEEELTTLATDIQEYGLQVPITLDSDGRIVDGRNRLLACQRVGVEPHFTTLPVEVDPYAYVRSHNDVRRHSTPGERAMAAALALQAATQEDRAAKRGRPRKNNTSNEVLLQRQAAHDHAASIPRVQMALLVLEQTPDLAPFVQRGSSLEAAYQQARIVQQRNQSEAELLRWLRAHHRGWATRVEQGEMTAAQAVAGQRAAAATAKEEKAVAAKEERLYEALTQLREQIGPVPPESPIPDLSISGAATVVTAPAASPAPKVDGHLVAQHELLKALVKVHKDLQRLAAQPHTIGDHDPEGQCYAVRSAIAHITESANKIAKAHNDAYIESKKFRRVL